jgi:hypothetical protein
MRDLLWLLAANPYNITAKEIDIPTTTNNIGVALANGARILMVLIGMVAIVFIIIGAIQITYSRGSAANVTRGRETLLYAVVGLVVAMAAYAFVTFVTGSLSK